MIINYINNTNYINEIVYRKDYIEHVSERLDLFFEKEMLSKLSNNDKFILYSLIDETSRFDMKNISVIESYYIDEDLFLSAMTNIVVEYENGETVVCVVNGNGIWGERKYELYECFYNFLNEIDFVDWFIDDAISNMGVVVYTSIIKNCYVNDVEFYKLCRFIYDTFINSNTEEFYSLYIYDTIDHETLEKEKIYNYECENFNKKRISIEHTIGERTFYIFYSL